MAHEKEGKENTAPSVWAEGSNSPERESFNRAIAGLLRTIGFSVFFSFILTEASYLLFLNVCAPVFPQALILFLMINIAGTAVIDKFFADNIAFLTLLVSSAGSVIVIDHFFGNSPAPTFLPFVNSTVVDIAATLGIAFAVYIVLNGLLDSVRSHKVSAFHLKVTLAVVVAAGAIYVIYEFQSSLISLFDQHSWIITIVVAVFSVLATYVYSTRREEKKISKEK